MNGSLSRCGSLPACCLVVFGGAGRHNPPTSSSPPAAPPRPVPLLELPAAKAYTPSLSPCCLCLPPLHPAEYRSPAKVLSPFPSSSRTASSSHTPNQGQQLSGSYRAPSYRSSWAMQQALAQVRQQPLFVWTWACSTLPLQLPRRPPAIPTAAALPGCIHLSHVPLFTPTHPHPALPFLPAAASRRRARLLRQRARHCPPQAAIPVQPQQPGHGGAGPQCRPRCHHTHRTRSGWAGSRGASPAGAGQRRASEQQLASSRGWRSARGGCPARAAPVQPQHSGQRHHGARLQGAIPQHDRGWGVHGQPRRQRPQAPAAAPAVEATRLKPHGALSFTMPRFQCFLGPSRQVAVFSPVF